MYTQYGSLEQWVAPAYPQLVTLGVDVDCVSRLWCTVGKYVFAVIAFNAVMEEHTSGFPGRSCQPLLSCYEALPQNKLQIWQNLADLFLQECRFYAMGQSPTVATKQSLLFRGLRFLQSLTPASQ